MLAVTGWRIRDNQLYKLTVKPICIYVYVHTQRTDHFCNDNVIYGNNGFLLAIGWLV